MTTEATMAPKAEWHEPLVQRLIDANDGDPPEEILGRFADQLRSSAGQNFLPIDPHLIASINGIKPNRAPFGFAGRIYTEPGGQLVMDINTRDSEQRQHFTEAHELMHSAFPGFRSEHRYRLDATAERNAENREEEYLCDYGAAALLMPKELVSESYEVRGGLVDVERLSSDAQVSIEAAANRLVAIADEPAVMLRLTWSHKPADRPLIRKGQDVPKRLRIRYGLCAHMRLYVPKFESADEDSVFCRAAHRGSIVSAVTPLPGLDREGPFRVQARAYGVDDLLRALVIARPTA